MSFLITLLTSPIPRSFRLRARHLRSIIRVHISAVGDSVISEQDEVDIPPETNGLPEDGAEIAENVMSDADAMEKETTE